MAEESPRKMLNYGANDYRREVARIATELLKAHVYDQDIDDVSERDVQAAVDTADRVLRKASEKTGE